MSDRCDIYFVQCWPCAQFPHGIKWRLQCGLTVVKDYQSRKGARIAAKKFGLTYKKDAKPCT